MQVEQRNVTVDTTKLGRGAGFAELPNGYEFVANHGKIRTRFECGAISGLREKTRD